MSTEEPAAKKAKPTGWEDHKLNCSEALMKSDEARHFNDIAKDSLSTIQGIGPHAKEVLDALGLHTVHDLGTYKFFLMARALKTLSETETKDGRHKNSVMNVDKALDKEFESKSFKDIVDSPIHALEGLSEKAEAKLKDLGVKTIADLAEWKYARWAEAICEIAKYENTLTATQRKEERELKKLA